MKNSSSSGRVASPIDWQSVKRVLVVRLRSIGDTVLTTPSLTALRRFLPEAEIDILLEDWVAPVLDGFEGVGILRIGTYAGSRLRMAARLATTGYDVAFNLHGGTTGTFLTTASRARHRVGLSSYRYAFLQNHLLRSSPEFWGTDQLHAAEQQLALLGSVGVPVEDRPRSSLAVTAAALDSVRSKIMGRGDLAAIERFEDGNFVLMHPAAAFATKQWAVANFARTAEFLAARGLSTVAVATASEKEVLSDLKAEARVPVLAFDDLTLPEITAFASKARLFIGNDSGIAHMAAAVNTPSVVIFGSSNRVHWRPRTNAPNEIVFDEFPCQPCPGYTCEVFGEPKCILGVRSEAVFTAVERVLSASKS